MIRKLRLLSAVALVAITCAGCGSGSADNGNTDSAAGVAGKKSTSKREKAVMFSQCMRENGVAAFADPDASGELTIDEIANGSSVDTNAPAFKAAISACRDLQPPGFTGTKRTSAQQEAVLRFARCVRDNGVKDFPDPAEGDPIIDTNKIPSTAENGGMSILNGATHKCRDDLAGVVNDR